MTARLVCSACGEALTNDCRWDEINRHEAACEARQSPVRAGFLVRLVEEDAVPVWDGEGNELGRKVYSPAGAVAANPSDVPPNALQSAGSDNGCCGSDGQDGPNRACTCGAVVATEWGDCWTRAEIRFLPDAVRVEED